MSRISTAVGSERISRVSGYRIKKGVFNESTTNLQQVIAILGVANDANIDSVPYGSKEIISADEAGKIYGYGSPIHQAMRILRPSNSAGVGGIPTFVIPLKTSGTKSVYKVSVEGVAEKNTRHSLKINGRTSLDFQNYSFVVSPEFTASSIYGSIAMAVNSVLSSPVIAKVVEDGVEITAKYSGSLADQISIEIETEDSVGLTYIVDVVKGSGSESLNSQLQEILMIKPTLILNPFLKETTLSTLETINGVPYVENPIGLYDPIEFSPFMAFTGTGEENIQNLLKLTSGRSEEVTNVIISAPSTKASPSEISASALLAFARTMQDSPEKDVNGMVLFDIPAPARSESALIAYEGRDMAVKNGISTTILTKGEYKIQDLVTTYHAEGEKPFQFSYARNLNLDWNIKHRYSQLEDRFLKDKVLIRDNQYTDSSNTIKPKEWKSNVFSLLDELAVDALINDPEWSKSSVQVQIDPENPNRFNTFFRYKRTGIARIQSTDVEAGF